MMTDEFPAEFEKNMRAKFAREPKAGVKNGVGSRPLTQSEIDRVVEAECKWLLESREVFRKTQIDLDRMFQEAEGE